jgi:hypothetical protein
MYFALIFLVLHFVQDASSQTVEMNSLSHTSSKLYAGKTADHWVSEVLRLAVTIRATEEDYEKSLRECVQGGKSLNDNVPKCIRANHSRFAAQSARNEYQRLLNAVSKSSLPEEWLRSHFTWVRFGKDWKRD